MDPYLLVIPPEWQVTPRSLRDLAGRPWVAGPPGTACDHALRRLAADAAIVIPDGDVCVEFPSVLALVAAGRGAGVIPQMAIGQAPVTVCALPPLGGRHIAAWHQAGPAQPTRPPPVSSTPSSARRTCHGKHLDQAAAVNLSICAGVRAKIEAKVL